MREILNTKSKRRRRWDIFYKQKGRAQIAIGANSVKRDITQSCVYGC